MNACDLCGTPFGRTPAPGVDCHMCNWPEPAPRTASPRLPAHERPLDVLLERLRAHGLGYVPGTAHQTWTATCPCCRHDALRISERRDELDVKDAGRVSVSCANKCHPERILRAAMEPGLSEGPRP